MTSIADVSVCIQTSSESVPSMPSWFGEVALILPYFRKQGALSAISSQVRLARRRFGHYEVIDFLAVLFGYAISGERTLEAFYERLTTEDYRGLTPLFYGHVEPYGKLTLDMTKRLALA